MTEWFQEEMYKKLVVLVAAVLRSILQSKGFLNILISSNLLKRCDEVCISLSTSLSRRLLEI